MEVGCSTAEAVGFLFSSCDRIWRRDVDQCDASDDAFSQMPFRASQYMERVALDCGLDNGLNSQDASSFALATPLKCCENGRHDWIRTNDLFRVKEAL